MCMYKDDNHEFALLLCLPTLLDANCVPEDAITALATKEPTRLTLWAVKYMVDPGHAAKSRPWILNCGLLGFRASGVGSCYGFAAR